jgi:magnesium transporter
MAQHAKRRSTKRGLSPGTLVHVGERKVEKVTITVIDYDENQYVEKEAETPEETFTFRDTPATTWINVEGLHEVGVIEKIGNHYGLHPLILEDILTTTQRPKMEDYGSFLFVVLKMYNQEGDASSEKMEQVSIILGSNFVISFLEKKNEVFHTIKERLSKGKGRLRKMGGDYLAYALIDAVVDGYFVKLEKLGETIELVEEELVTNPKPATLRQIHNLKRDMIYLRKSVWPLREVLSGLQRAETSLIKESTDIFLKDVYDHTIQAVDTIETYRDILSGMLDTYLSSVSNRMNEVMKVLTIIATIFIPLTFIVGIYGMNFDFMPELRWRFGYFIILIVMIAIVVFMVAYFKKRRWL